MARSDDQVSYCGVVVDREHAHLCSLVEVRAPEPPIRLRAHFYEPGAPDHVVAELRALGAAAIAVAAPSHARPATGSDPAGSERACDRELQALGVAPQPFLEPGARLFDGLSALGVFAPQFEPGADQPVAGVVPEGGFRSAPVFETNAEGVFCALQGRRLPAKRHPLGIRRRIQELLDDHVNDEGGDLWHRRIEEIEAAAAALAAHRYAVGHAYWLGDPDEGVIVLPGARPPERFSSEGVIPPVPRLSLASA